MMNNRKIRAVAAIGGILMLGLGSLFAKADEPLKVGDPAPKLTLALDDGSKLEVGAPRERALIVYFYPKDDTPGCTKEACTFRDRSKEFADAGADVVGISFDDAESHKAFRQKFKIPFMLATDPDGSVAKAFGVGVKNFLVTKIHARDTIVIGKDARIRAVLRGVDPVQHVDEVLKALKDSGAGQ
jgi:peroxiredoxin Q/BCP